MIKAPESNTINSASTQINCIIIIMSCTYVKQVKRST